MITSYVLVSFNDYEKRGFRKKEKKTVIKQKSRNFHVDDE